jgi:ABC-type Zn2+ transport system substrate-binding protein/surface adhesin
LKEIADSLGGVVGTENREMSTNLKDLDNEIAAINKEIAENKKALKRKKLIKKQFKIGRDEKMNLKKIM